MKSFYKVPGQVGGKLEERLLIEAPDEFIVALHSLQLYRDHAPIEDKARLGTGDAQRIAVSAYMDDLRLHCDDLILDIRSGLSRVTRDTYNGVEFSDNDSHVISDALEYMSTQDESTLGAGNYYLQFGSAARYILRHVEDIGFEVDSPAEVREIITTS